MSEKIISIALAGNPNSGKTTTFNNMTGARQKVGNWPGVTVEKKEGTIHQFGYDLRIIDLPGTYSLTPFTIEEIIARNFILDESPDVVIDIIDASNLERSLYLATQLRELDCKVLFALNMADLARERGIKIDADKLSELLDLPVVFTVGNKNEGIEALLKSAVELAESNIELPRRRRVHYTHDIEEAISILKPVIETVIEGKLPYNSRWVAIKLIENDKIIREKILQVAEERGQEILDKTNELRKHLSERYNDDPEIVMTEERYGFIAGIVKEVVVFSTIRRVDISRNVDLVLTNRFLGFPIFIFFIWAMFQLTFTLGEYPMNGIDHGIQFIINGLGQIIPDGLFKDFLLNGVIAGVGSVIVFLPNILILFFCIAIFEDTGYMARAAFLMDKIMHLIGLHGKSFIPMLMGFGCNVPAIIAARTLESEKDRILTILITPFMSCSARLPVYIILAGAFFSNHAGTVIFSIYFLGILVSIITGRLFRSTLLKGADAPFVMELPPYRIPMLKSLMIHMWERSKMFLKKMGGIILIGSVVIWGLATFPREVQFTKDYDAEMDRIATSYQTMIKATTGSERMALEKRKKEEIRQLNSEKQEEIIGYSLMARIGKFIAPVFAPLGIDWRGSIALLSGFVAKEIIVSTMGILYNVQDSEETETLQHALLSSSLTPLSALSMMIFVLLYVPCLATIAAIRKETGSVRWMLFNVAYSTFVAWGMAFVVYQGGRLIGIQ